MYKMKNCQVPGDCSLFSCFGALHAVRVWRYSMSLVSGSPLRSYKRHDQRIRYNLECDKLFRGIMHVIVVPQQDLCWLTLNFKL